MMKSPHRRSALLARTMLVTVVLAFSAGSAFAGFQLFPQAFQMQTADPPPPGGPGGLTSSHGPVGDEYCGPGHVPCDEIFVAYCKKVLGGTMSGPQPWGGQTCFEPS
jgi:hypothetical protein